jgi:subtilisin family serine protease
LTKSKPYIIAKSVPLIKANNVHVSPYTYTGSGVTVAVIDTGIDTDHPDLANDIVAQRCFLPAGKCPSSLSSETESNNAEDDQGHGTHVAGIVTSPVGVAPNAKIVAVKVCDSGGSCVVSDSIAALNWIRANLNTQPVQIINMSLGMNKYNDTGACESSEPSYNTAVNLLVDKGVTIFASSGNDGYSTHIGRPGCFSNTIAVGATYKSEDYCWKKEKQVNGDLVCTEYKSLSFCDNWKWEKLAGVWNLICNNPSPSCISADIDQVACFSNSNNLVDVLAPGAMIVSSKKDGGTKEKYGTSQATPMAAGVAALMLEANPTLTQAQIRTVLKDTGKPIVDTRNSLTFPRIDVLAAVNKILPGTLQFSSSAYTVNENGSSITITVTRTGGNYGAIAVNYITSNGSATAGSDYNISNGTLNWNDGETANNIFTVSITDDSDFKGDENFTVSLSNPTGGTSIGTQNQATITIVENESPPPVVKIPGSPA